MAKPMTVTPVILESSGAGTFTTGFTGGAIATALAAVAASASALMANSGKVAL